MNKNSVLKQFVLGSIAATLAYIPLQSHAQVIAEYNFNPSNFYADSSGNGHNLNPTAPGVSSSPDHALGSPSPYSAYFDGTQQDLFATPINFGVFGTQGQLSINFYARILDSGYLFDQQGFMGIEFSASNNQLTLFQQTNNQYTVGYYILDTASSWHEYTAVFDNTDPLAGTVTLYIDGAAATPSFTQVNPQTLVEKYFTIGSRVEGNPTPFEGYIGDVTIAAVPEPSSVALIGLGVGVFLVIASRKRIFARYSDI